MSAPSITRMIADLEYIKAILRGGKMPKPGQREILVETIDALLAKLVAKGRAA